MNEKITGLLKTVIHPEHEINIVDAGIVESCRVENGKINITLNFIRSRDPFATGIKKQVVSAICSAFPEFDGNVSVTIKESAPKVNTQPYSKPKGEEGIKNIIAIASGKGGVGKSTVTANLAVTLASMGKKVGVLDADIYGPSQAKMFAVEDYVPTAENHKGTEMIIPAESHGVKIMSIGFFIDPSDALVWRGPMATSALKQLIHQTDWGMLDFLLIDLPPGTGDVHLTIMQEVKIDGAVIVTTPQQIAVADVVRGISMFTSDKLHIPVLGIIENMAWFTPEELPDNKYYIFGKGGGKELAHRQGIPFLSEVPIIQSVMQGAEDGTPSSLTSEVIKNYYQQAAEKIVENLNNSVG